MKTRWPAALLCSLPLLAMAAVPGVHSQQVGAHSYYVEGDTGPASSTNRGFNSNAGFVITDDGVVVFDALGTPALARALLAEIRRRTDQPIRYLIVSHYHADHVYGAGVLRQAGAEIWMHRSAREYLDSALAGKRLAQRRLLFADDLGEDFSLPLADRWLDGDEHFSIGGVDFELRHVGPAHAPDDMVLLVPGDGVMFVGDLLFVDRVPFIGETSSARWLRALDRLDDPGFHRFVPGHGPAGASLASAVSLTRCYLLDLRQKMGDAVAEMIPFDEAFSRADWSRWRDLPAFDQAHRGNAYTVYLEMEQESLDRRSEG